MGILDEAIREHLELKRAHGAGDDELKQLEDEAFGQAERPGDEAPPDPLAEAPTRFMTQPELDEEPAGRREPTIADLQEPPEPPAPAEPAAAEEIEPTGPSTEERQAIAEQPTELFDVEEELGPPNPTDEEILEEEISEPRLGPTDPLAGLQEGEEAEVTIEGPAPDDDEEYDDEDDAFWNEQRLSDELDQALEAPPREIEIEIEESEAEYDEEPESEADVLEDEELEDGEPESTEEPHVAAPRQDEDVLEETPDFLEEAPEDDQLWFEQKPPKDFDFDD